MIESANGNCLPAVDVFAMALKFLRDKAVEQINREESSHLPNKKIQWIITVPTIWTDVAKDVMRKAATKVIIRTCSYILHASLYIYNYGICMYDNYVYVSLRIWDLLVYI